MEIAVPINAGIVKGISGIKMTYLSVRKRTVNDTMSIYNKSNLILFRI
jgi:hypothetical protein